MGLIWIPQTRTRQPQSVVPPAQEFVSATSFAARQTFANSGGSFAPRSGGIAHIGNGSSAYATRTIKNISSAPPLFLAVHCCRIGTPSSGAVVYSISTGSYSGAMFALRTNASGGAYLLYRTENSGAYFDVGTSSAVLPLNTDCGVVCVAPSLSQGDAYVYVNGIKYNSVVTSGTLSAAYTNYFNETVNAAKRDSVSLYAPFAVYSAGYGRQITEQRAQEISLFPNRMFEPAEITIWFTDAGSGVTGTAAVTEAADTAAASGTITHLGTAAVTESGDTAAAIGYLSHLGTAAITEGADVAAAIGTVGSGEVIGTAAITEAGDIAAASGYLSHLATAAITEGADVAAASGTSGDPLYGFTQAQLDFLVSYLAAHSPKTHLNAITGEVEYLLPIGA